MFAALLSAGSYVLKKIGRMKCASKLGIEKGWRIFIPVVGEWLTGKMAIQCDMIRNLYAKPKKWHVIYVPTKIFAWISAAAAIVCSMLLITLVFVTQNRFVKIILMIFGQYLKEISSKINAAKWICILILIIALNILLFAKALELFFTYKLYAVFSLEKNWFLFILTLVVPVAEAVIVMIFGCSKKFIPLS